MKKITLMLFVILTSWQVNSQATYNYGWEPSGLGGWTNAGSTGNFARSTTTPCTGSAAVRANIYYDLTNTFTSPSLGTSIGGLVTFGFSYKVTQFSANGTGAPANLVQLEVQWANSTSGPWTTFKTINSSNHVVSASCATITENFVPGTGNLYVRFLGKAIGSDTDLYFYYDNITVTEVSPNPPTLTSFAPTSGCSSTGTVVITGTNLAGATAVTIGGTPVASYVVNSPTQITANIGTGTTGTISVTTTFGTATSAGTYTINPSPIVAAIAGGSATVCANGVTPAFTNATTGGTWAITNGTGSATISTGGIVSGVTVGTAIVNYTVSDGTCSTTVNYPITVTAIPTPVSISGVVSPACSGSIQTLTAVGGSINTTFVNETFSGAAIPTGWTATAGSGDTVSISTTNLAGGTANEVRIVGNSQTNLIIDRLAYGPFNSSGLTSVDVEWKNYLDHYQNDPYVYTVKVETSTDGINWHDSSWVYSPAADIGPGVQNTTVSTVDVGSTTLYVAFTASGRTFGFDRWSIDDVKISGVAPATIVWSPTTGLYTDAAATVAYTGTAATTVYAKPTADTTYTVTATNAAGCSVTSAGAAIVVAAPTAQPTGSSPQTFTAGQTVANLVASGTGLLWYSNAAGTASIPTTTPLVNGTTYYVTQTVSGCPSTTLAILAQESLGTNSFNNSGLTAYPNPVRDVLNLGYATEMSKIQVVNMLGQEVMVKNVNSNQTEINLSNLASGSYLVKVSVDNNVKTIKVIKE